MRTYYAICRDVVAQADRERYLATLYAPQEHRDALFAVFAFGLEIARVRDVAREPLPGEIRLQWWREVLHGERGEQGLANPVSAALLDTIRARDLPLSPFERLIDAHTFDLYNEPMVSVAALETYAAETQGALLATGARILGLRETEYAAILQATANALIFAQVLTDLPRHAARKQLYIPADVLAHYSAKREDILARNATTEVRAALAEMRLRARKYLDEAERLRNTASAGILPLLLPASLVRPALQRMERQSYEPFAVESEASWRRQWRLWRAARDPRKIFA